MNVLPIRQSVVQQVADIIRDGILTRRWQGNLPARRALSSGLQVSRNTVDAAIHNIQKEGLIKSVSRHRSKIMKVRSKQTNLNPERVIYLDGRRLEDFSPFYRSELLVFQQKVQSKGYGFILQTNLTGHTLYTPKMLKSWINDERATCWFLASQPPEIQRYFEKAGVCSIVVGALAPGVMLPCLDLDLAATARHAANRLVACGHKGIAFLRPRRVSSDVMAMEQGFDQALLRSSSAECWKFEHDLTGESVAKCLASAQRKSKAMDAIITTSVADAMRVLGCLSAAANRKPGHPVTIVSLEGDPLFDWVEPMISYYDLGQNVVARKLCYLVDRRTRLDPRYKVLISPRHVAHFSSRI